MFKNPQKISCRSFILEEKISLNLKLPNLTENVNLKNPIEIFYLKRITKIQSFFFKYKKKTF